MKFQAFGIVNQNTRTLYSFQNKAFADHARLSLKDFDDFYEQYTLDVEVKEDGSVFISDQGIEDLEEPVFLQKLGTEYLSLGESELKEKMISDFSLLKGELGYSFNFKESTSPDLEEEFDI